MSNSSDFELKDNDFDDQSCTFQRYKPLGLNDLVKKTRFSKEELQIMYRGFKQQCPSGEVSRETFIAMYSDFFPYTDSSIYAQFVFRTLDKENIGKINFEQFVGALSTIARGTYEEKLSWIFSLYDIGGTGHITKEEMYTVIKSIYGLLGKHSTLYSEDSGCVATAHMENIFQKMDMNKDGIISWDEFSSYCLNNTDIITSLDILDTKLC